MTQNQPVVVNVSGATTVDCLPQREVNVQWGWLTCYNVDANVSTADAYGRCGTQVGWCESLYSQNNEMSLIQNGYGQTRYNVHACIHNVLAST